MNAQEARNLMPEKISIDEAFEKCIPIVDNKIKEFAAQGLNKVQLLMINWILNTSYGYRVPLYSFSGNDRLSLAKRLIKYYKEQGFGASGNSRDYGSINIEW